MKKAVRKAIIAGNWKMNKTRPEAKELLEAIKPLVANAEGKVEVIACVPFTNLETAINATAGSNVKIGAENVHFEKSGAFTGEVSVEMIKDLNAEYVIIGHSERRQYFGETDETVNAKMLQVLKNDMTPIVCVGETLEQYEAGTTKDVVKTQVVAAYKDVCPKCAARSVIAYEPVWAIGTGKSATPAQAQAVHKFIRDHIAKADAKIAEQVIIQYGGSVNAANAAELFAQPDIDGALVGGASLKADAFAVIVKAAEAAKQA